MAKQAHERPGFAAGYNPRDILGPRIAFAPIEDLAFGFALILLTLSCWARLTGRRVRPASPADPA